jgi:hypothetical protein
MRTTTRRARTLALFALIAFAFPAFATAAESTTGGIVISVVDATGAPVANAHVTAIAASNRLAGATDARGSFTLLGLVPDTYTVSVTATGYEPSSRDGVTVLPGQTQQVAFSLAKSLHTIASIRSTAKSFAVGSTSDTFTVTGEAARATAPTEGASGLGAYTQGTVQGSIVAVPGVDQDAFANAILRGGKIEDAVFDYDSVAVPQGLVAEPGGNITGAQLFTTGIGSVTTTLAGFEAEGQNALGGVIDLIPSVGTYPGTTTLDVFDGAGALDQGFSLTSLWATPNLRWRYAFSTTAESQYLSYGDGTTFYPTEGGYGLALQSRGQYSSAGNVHFQPDPKDDLSFVALFGEANYDEYDTPFEGETYGYLNGTKTVFPGVPDQNALVDTPARVRGTYDVLKAQWIHTMAHSLARLQVFQSQFGSVSQGSWWDDDSYPDGQISIFARQGGREEGMSYDIDDVANAHQHFKYGVQYTTNNSFLNQVVPTADEYINSNPTIFTELAYLGDTWSLAPRLDVTGTLRANFNHIVPSDGSIYDDNFIDPHLALAYRIGSDYAFRATYDRTNVAPKPLEADRTDTSNPAPFVPLLPETANNFTYSFEGGGKTQFRLTYFAEREMNRIDVLPVNFRSAVTAGQNPIGVGVPTNAGELRAKGTELWIKRGGFSLDADYIRAYSSSAAQFAFNGLNAAAVAAGHLFPVGYIPDFTAILSYEADFAHRRLRITPALSYESGYPYGNGSKVWIFGPNGKPEQVDNDNNLNPGYNYYFLLNPACPLNEVPVKPLTPTPAASRCIPGYNPYIANLATGEAADPNSLRTTPQLLTSLHIEGDLSPRVTAILDVANLLGVDTPQQLLGNQYLIGPPGYTGGNRYYEYWYAQQECPAGPKGNVTCPGGTTYDYGNGVPTNYFPTATNGQNHIRRSVPWNYGTGAYIPLGYPMARTVQFRLRYRL